MMPLEMRFGGAETAARAAGLGLEGCLGATCRSLCVAPFKVALYAPEEAADAA